MDKELIDSGEIFSTYDEDLKLCKSKTDNVEQLVWLLLEEITLQEIKPTFLKENINNIINEKNIIHIIEERDR